MSRTGLTETRSRFARRLKAIRVPQGFRTARSFAEALGIDENRYTRYERGEVEPNLELLMRMCELLNATPNDLLCDFVGHPEGELAQGFVEEETHYREDVEGTRAGGGQGDADARHSGSKLRATAWLLASEIAGVAETSERAEATPLDRLRRTSGLFDDLLGDPFAVLRSISSDLSQREIDLESQQRITRLIEAFANALRDEPRA